ncbi:MAG: hypothetical protein O3B81_00735, partial [Actinomycetota bacterium]|nr:hypothetical protein [Actinomycetota bacterium]
KNLPIGSKIIIFIFLLSGSFHLIDPGVFYALIPPILGMQNLWIVLSGILEIVCAIGLVTKQKWAPKLTAGVLLVIWVGNWWYAIDVTWNLESSWLLILGSWLRLPLQIPLIQWALRSPVKKI